ncbi:hypothetical protein BCR33DRAFT_342640 [Rhizoclosmatium globosum]|uniref:Protein ARV n=1 Tax=Rhizoclosmatium globosum TaxID=329046 RepID=A0A1Y2C2P9_9FUNG|nr:hypothetical protein BCR33DRAFT_342640 [Rhizoclosmatium globosum]|eukprot:ORY41236.1 hypothetical protein BCR33DRAFT_342640 [Rhizoclosmatium globosum]
MASKLPSLTTEYKCIHCASSMKALYREYSKGNIRLELCKHCKQFADHYIENDTIVVFIDMVLMKKPVFRHLLHNRLQYNSLGINMNVSKLAVILILFEVYVKWFTLEKYHGKADFMATESIYKQYLYILSLCVFESTLWHIAIRTAVWLLHKQEPAEEAKSIVWYNKVSMSLIISSYGKLFLLLMAIWDYKELDYAWLLNVFVVMSNLEALSAFLNTKYIETGAILGVGVLVRVLFGSFWWLEGATSILLI